MSKSQIGFAVKASADGTVTFRRASVKERTEGLILAIMTTHISEWLSRGYEKGGQVTEFIHEFAGDTFSYQITVEVNKRFITGVPGYILRGVFVDSDPADEHVQRLIIAYSPQNNMNQMEKMEIPLSMFGVT
jgi:hypothetical protein